MAKARSKLSRKELLKKDDAFLSAASQGAKWVAANRLPVVIGSILVVGVILGTWGIVEHIRARDRQASDLYKRGLVILEGKVLTEGSDEQPNPDGVEPTFATEEDRWKAAREQFAEVVERTGGSGVATLAAFFVADLDERLGEVGKAEEGFVELAASLSSSDSLQFLAVERAAYLQEARGDTDAALKTLSKLVNVDGGFYNDYASFHQARLYLHLNDQARARKLLERIEEKHPTSPIIDSVRQRLALLGPAPVGRSLESKGETGGAENDEEVSTEASGEAAASETAGTGEKTSNTQVASGAAVGSVAKTVDQEPASDAAEGSDDEASP